MTTDFPKAAFNPVSVVRSLGNLLTDYKAYAIGSRPLGPAGYTIYASCARD
jgi:hypothetical protein